MPNSWDLRAADSDREHLAEELREHMLAGRLSSEEFEQRLGDAYKASTRGQLEVLKRDLPVSQRALRGELERRRGRVRHRLMQEAGAGLSISAVCVAIWALAGANGTFWPGWVIFFSLLPLLRDGWRLFGPDPDLEGLERRLDRRRDREHRRAHRRHWPPRPPGLPR